MGKYLRWSLFLIKNFKAALLKRDEFCGIFKITCFEQHLRTAAFIRRYFDTINLKQSGLYTTFSFKILASERKCKNNLENCDTCNCHTYNVYAKLYYEIPWF